MVANRYRFFEKRGARLRIAGDRTLVAEGRTPRRQGIFQIASSRSAGIFRGAAGYQPRLADCDLCILQNSRTSGALGATHGTWAGERRIRTHEQDYGGGAADRRGWTPPSGRGAVGWLPHA